MLESPGELLKITGLWDFPSGPTITTFVFQCRDVGSIPGGGIMVPQALGCSNKKKVYNLSDVILSISLHEEAFLLITETQTQSLGGYTVCQTVPLSEIVLERDCRV